MYGNGNIDLIVNDYHGKLNVYLLNISGQVINEKIINSVLANSRITNIFSTESFSKGVYIIAVKGKNLSNTMKIIVK